MIDVETEVFSYIAGRLRTEFLGIYVASVKKRVPSSFPAAQIVEMNNMVATDTTDSSGIEKHADVMYEVNVYSNLASGAKKQAKEIIRFIDNCFSELGFARQICDPIDNGDTSIYRYIARYIARISESKTVYQR